jgi:hypothetical protein
MDISFSTEKYSNYISFAVKYSKIIIQIAGIKLLYFAKNILEVNKEWESYGRKMALLRKKE